MTNSGPWTPDQRLAGPPSTQQGGQSFGTQSYGFAPGVGQPYGEQPVGNGQDGQSPKKGGWLKWVLIVIAVLVFAGMCSSMVGGDDDAATEAAAHTSEQTPPAAPAGAADPEPVSGSDQANLPVADSEPDAESALEPTMEPAPAPEPAADEVPREFHNALRSAQMYLKTMPFSKQGLADQLEFESYSPDAARYAVDTVDADWNAQAVKSGEMYVEMMGFSPQGLIDQLTFDGYTQSEAEYAAAQLF